LYCFEIDCTMYQIYYSLWTTVSVKGDFLFQEVTVSIAGGLTTKQSLHRFFKALSGR